jgi:spore germination protein PC
MSLQNDFYTFINQLASQLKRHEEKLAKLEKVHADVMKSIETLKNQPPINVERIDYHFDQLKIERLDGTLNIGLNPQDLQEMDEFSIPAPHFRKEQSEKSKVQLNQLQDRLNTYLEKELPLFIEKAKKEMGLELDQSYAAFIQEDIRRQLPDRLAFYSQKIAKTRRDLSANEEEQEIYQMTIHDIQQAIYAFLRQFPTKGQKGEEKNDLGSD